MRPVKDPYGNPSKEYLERYYRNCWFCERWNKQFDRETEPCLSCMKNSTEKNYHPNFRNG